MKIFITFLLFVFVSSGGGQTRIATFTVITSASDAHSAAPKHIRAVLPAEDNSEHLGTLKIKFYPEALDFVLNGKSGLLEWFSYTNPPKDKRRIFVEADQTSFGSLLYRNTLYVCQPGQPQQSLPVINQLLASTLSGSLTKIDAQSVALMLAKCSDTLQVYGDPQSTSEPAQKRMQNIASPPVSTMVDQDVRVEFYSWSALPDGTISKWTFLFRANRLLTVTRTGVSKAAPSL